MGHKMNKTEIIKVRLSPATLVLTRAKTRLTGEGLSGYVRRLIMADLGNKGVDNPARGGVSIELADKSEVDLGYIDVLGASEVVSEKSDPTGIDTEDASGKSWRDKLNSK